jgi:hypothetical protein
MGPSSKKKGGSGKQTKKKIEASLKARKRRVPTPLQVLPESKDLAGPVNSGTFLSQTTTSPYMLCARQW